MSGLLTLSNFTEFPKSLDGEFRKFYLEELRERAPHARIFTNTHPHAIHNVGRLATALPNCRFVFVKRNSYDLALRIFAMKYKSGNQYAYNIKTILEYLTWYHGMVDIWLEKLPSVCRVINYENMIADPRAALQTIVELCGAPLSDGVLTDLGDDRGCAIPYRGMIDSSLAR